MKKNFNQPISVLAALLLCHCLHAADAKAPEKKAGGAPKMMMMMPPPVVTIAPVTEITKTAPKEYIGTVKAIEEVDLPSRISGLITGIKFKEGSLVKKGDLLFTIEDTSYRAKAIAAQTKVDQLAAELKYAESNYQRQKRLASSDAVSKSNYEDAQRLIDATKARYEQNKAELMDAENDLSYTKIYAPISGRIGEVKHTYGNYVTPTSTYLAKIVSVDPMQVRFSISERDFLNLFKNINSPNPDIAIAIRLSNGEEYAIPGKVAFIDNLVDNETGTISIWTEFANPDMKLLPGGYVTVLLSEKLKQSYPGVRMSAILSDRDGNYVYVVDKEGQATRRNVKVGEVVGSNIVITSGVRLGEMVITDGTHKVIPGVPVKPVVAGKE